ncbi:MAG: FHA domain-containing protein [Pirellulaceae bacterium]|nr:FHA domain-containing protein [Pirellulaceae bacterium]
MLQAKLVVIGGAKATEISLKLPAVIGRGRDAGLTLPHPLVSRNHCQLFESDGMLHVKDLNSLNGTYVNSQRIEDTATLEPEQLLTIGNVTFRAIYSPTDASIAEVEPSSSHVIEFEEVSASPESDSQLDPADAEMQNRPTEEKSPHEEHPSVVPENAFIKTVHLDELSQSSDILDELSEDVTPGSPEHSILAALQDVGLGVNGPEQANMTDIRSQLPGDMKPEVNQVDGLVVDPAQAPADKVDLPEIELNESANDKVEANESALGTFIRNLPR